MPMTHWFAALTAAALVATTGGCGSSNLVAPTSPALPTTTDTFTATLAPLGIDQQKFTIGTAGFVDFTLYPTDPVGADITIALGQPDSTNKCVSNEVNLSFPPQKHSWSEGSRSPGLYCVIVTNESRTASVTYRLDVAHP